MIEADFTIELLDWWRREFPDNNQLSGECFGGSGGSDLAVMIGRRKSFAFGCLVEGKKR